MEKRLCPVADDSGDPLFAYERLLHITCCKRYPMSVVDCLAGWPEHAETCLCHGFMVHCQAAEEEYAEGEAEEYAEGEEEEAAEEGAEVPRRSYSRGRCLVLPFL